MATSDYICRTLTIWDLEGRELWNGLDRVWRQGDRWLGVMNYASFFYQYDNRSIIIKICKDEIQNNFVGKPTLILMEADSNKITSGGIIFKNLILPSVLEQCLELQKILMRNAQQDNRYSIKHKLSQEITCPQPPSPSPPLKQSEGKIFMPEYHNYFLHTIQKQIKHEGSLFKILKQKITDFKQRRFDKKKIKNSKHSYSHLMFSSYPIRKSHIHTKNLQQTCLNSLPFHQIHRKYITSAAPSARQTFKIKASSISTNFDDKQRKKDEKQNMKKQCPNSNSSSFHPSKGSFSEIRPKSSCGKFLKQKKRINENELSVMGGAPLWKNFESCRNSVYMIKIK